MFIVKLLQSAKSSFCIANKSTYKTPTVCNAISLKDVMTITIESYKLKFTQDISKPV